MREFGLALTGVQHVYRRGGRMRIGVIAAGITSLVVLSLLLVNRSPKVDAPAGSTDSTATLTSQGAVLPETTSRQSIDTAVLSGPPAAHQVPTPAAGKASSAIGEKPIGDEPPESEPRTPKVTVRLRISPVENTVLFVDQTEQSLDQAGIQLSLQPGRHIFSLRNPAYPMIVDTLDIVADRPLSFDFAERFHQHPIKRLLVGSRLNTASGIISILLNGRRQQYDPFAIPKSELPIVAGVWQMAFVASLPGGERANIDSVTFTGSGCNGHASSPGNEIMVDLSAPEWYNCETIHIVLW